MPFKINVSEKGKTFHLETESESIIEKTIGETIPGEDIFPELKGYVLEITGASDKAGIPAFKEVEGQGLKRGILTYGKGMHKKPKGLRKKRRKSPKGLRLRKTVRGNVISQSIVQINMNVKKSGGKKLEDIFPEQCKPKAKEEAKKEEKPAEQPVPAAQA